MSSANDVDILVIGSGVAGLAAALSAREHGAARVLISEAERVVGGSSRLSGGLIMGAGTRYQKARGIEDTADSLFHDYIQLNQWQVETGVVRRFADAAGPTVDWLGDQGVEFHDRLVFGGDERVPRVHVPIGYGQAVVEVLHRRCREAEVDIALDRRIDHLIVDVDGVVRGAAVGDDAITAGAVIMASGGFGSDPDKLRAHYPSAATTEWSWYIGAEGSRGDALDLGAQVRAQVVGHDRGLRLLHPGFTSIYEPYLPGWMMLLNGEGHRFCDETAPYGIMDSLVRAQSDRVYAVFDHTTIGAATVDRAARYKHTIPGLRVRQSPNWNLDTIEQEVRSGKVHAAQTLTELAAQLGLPPDHVTASVQRYNAHADAGQDGDYLKAAQFLEPIGTAPFYGAEVRPATVCLTSCGLRIDRDAAVLDEDGRVVVGLYAAGECTGGVMGAVYVGSGNSYANCAVFGRVAGAGAARSLALA